MVIMTHDDDNDDDGAMSSAGILIAIHDIMRLSSNTLTVTQLLSYHAVGLT